MISPFNRCRWFLNSQNGRSLGVGVVTDPGQIVAGTVAGARGVEALGGVMGRATDASRIQFRMLNRSKGPAVWSPRAQCDRGLYPRKIRSILDELPALTLFQDMVTGLLEEEGVTSGIETRTGIRFKSKAVVVTAGTFLRGKIHMGHNGVDGGRAGEAPARGSKDRRGHALPGTRR